jgi:hypothetical protein
MEEASCASLFGQDTRGFAEVKACYSYCSLFVNGGNASTETAN